MSDHPTIGASQFAKEAEQIVVDLVAIHEANSSGKPLLSAQGQGMDGFTHYANLREIEQRAVAIFKRRFQGHERSPNDRS